MKQGTLIGAATLALLLAACGERHEAAGHQDEHGHDQAAGIARGEHGGRLLEEQQGYALELAIAEAGTPPKFRAWLYREGKLLAPAGATVEIKLQRLGNVAENHVLEPQADGSLMAATVVGEPHSFDVQALVTIDGKPLTWGWES